MTKNLSSSHYLIVSLHLSLQKQKVSKDEVKKEGHASLLQTVYHSFGKQ